MTSISSIGSAWSNASLQRSMPPRNPEKLLSKLDSDQSGGVDGTELQSLIEDVSQKLGVDLNAQDLLTQADADGDGSLNAEELDSAMQSLLPPPPDTLAFAQSRGMAGDDLFSKVDSDGDGSVNPEELQALLEKMSGGTASQTGVSSEERFAQLDTDGDGLLSQAEFDADRAASGQGAPAGMAAAGGMPPPGGPGGAGGAGGAAATSSSTTYDPLDTNEDGVVSLAERLAGSSSVEEAAQALFSAIDTDSDGSLSSEEAQSFMDQLQQAAQGPQRPPRQEEGTTSLSLGQLAEQARREYAAIASDPADQAQALSALA